MLYTDDYQKQLKDEHAKGSWGGGAYHKIKYIDLAFNLLGVTDVIDYGCGVGAFKRGVEDSPYNWTVHEYDPGVEGKETPPEPQDALVCIDVLEHIEPDLIDDVLSHIASLTNKVAFLDVCKLPASKILDDGRNAHLIIQPTEWWEAKYEEYFTIVKTVYDTKGHYSVIVKSK